MRLGVIIVIGLLILLVFGGRLLPLLGGLLGQNARKPMRQAKWMWATLGGSEEEVQKAEDEFGKECAREFEAQFRNAVDPRLEALVRDVGGRLAGAAVSGRRFAFRVVAAPAANAFALPGGFVFVTDSLLELCERRPDEVALLLGHEMAHAALGHAREKLMVDQVLKVVTARAAGAGQLARRLLNQGYSRDHEYEADAAGLRLAARAGFDAAGGIQVLRRLMARSPADSPLEEYFASHPPLGDRIRLLEDEARG